MNPRNRRMFRPQNAGKQAAGILASSPQLMQSVQKRANGGSISASPTFFGQQTPGAKFGGSTYGGMTFGGGNPRLIPGAKFGGSTYGGMTFGGGNPRLIPSGPPQRVPGNVFANILTPKGKTALSGSGIANLLSPAAATVPDGSLYRPGTGGNGLASSPEIAATDVLRSRLFPELDEDDANAANAAATIITDADREDADAGILPSEQLATSAVSGSQTQVDGASTTDQETSDERKVTDSQTTATTANTINKMVENVDAATKGNKPPNKINPDQAVTEEPITMASLVLADRTNPEEVDLEKISKEATELLGIEPGKLDERRKDAFYFNLMKAGLAIAAGGSSNAMTNIAKGLSFGVNEYGKDISDLNEEERENRKEFANLKYRMIKDQETANIAAATATNQWNQNKADIQNNYNIAKYNADIAQDERAYQRLQDQQDLELKLADQAYARATLEGNTLFQIGKLKQGDETLRLQQRELTNAENQQIIANNLTFLQTQPDVVKILVANGDLEIVDGKMNYTGQGERNQAQDVLNSAALIEAAGATSKSKPTDTTNLAESISKAYNIDIDEAVILANQIGPNFSLQDAYKDLTGQDLPILQSTQNQQPATQDGFGQEVSVN